MDLNSVVTLSFLYGVSTRAGWIVCQKFKDFTPSDKELLGAIYQTRIKNRRYPPLSVSTIEKAREKANKITYGCERDNVNIITCFSDAYPQKLSEIDQPPYILYCKGNVTLLNESSSIAVIGTRTPSDYGYAKGYTFAKKIAEEGINIVSGLALGCDTAGHKAALAYEGKTVAFLPAGFRNIYPKENIELAREIAEYGGLLVSEYHPYKNIEKKHFVERDRLQSGLSSGVFVIETAEKDGTMHTVKFAIKQKRNIACLYSHPDEIRDHEKFKGNKLLVENSTAIPIESEDDLYKFIDNCSN